MFLLAAEEANRIVGLVTGAPVADEGAGWWWRGALIAIGLGAAACAAGVAVWRLRTSEFDAEERAFGALARRRGLGAGARELVRKAAELKGCAPVALLVSRHAMVEAISALRESAPRADAARG